MVVNIEMVYLLFQTVKLFLRREAVSSLVFCRRQPLVNAQVL